MANIENAGVEETSEDTYLNDMREDPNNMSKWFPAIMPKDGESRRLRIPKTVIVQVPEEVCHSFFMERQGDRERVIQFVQNEVMPKAKEAHIYPSIFMKNGGFSDKYRFNLCTPGADELNMALNLIGMNYDALALARTAPPKSVCGSLFHTTQNRFLVFTTGCRFARNFASFMTSTVINRSMS